MAHHGVGGEHRVLVPAKVAEAVGDEAPQRGQGLHRVTNTTGHDDLRALYEEVSAYPVPPGLDTDPGPVDPQGRHRRPAAHPHAPRRHGVLSTIATFGAPADVTLSELAVESFFPMDERTDALLRTLASMGAQG
ncbi:helix-turn-helix transcriptional regulator [Streptomyces californicus]